MLFDDDARKNPETARGTEKNLPMEAPQAVNVNSSNHEQRAKNDDL